MPEQVIVYVSRQDWQLLKMGFSCPHLPIYQETDLQHHFGDYPHAEAVKIAITTLEGDQDESG